MPVVGTHDLFEQAYTADFRALTAPYGLFITYENDRAAIDVGLHLFDPTADPGTVGQVKVWFQLKGIRASTISAEEMVCSEWVALSRLRSDHISYWFAQPEPLYLVVYLEALDRFLAADIRDLVEASGGIGWLRELEAVQQRTTTLRIPLTATLEDALHRMPLHRSMRMDGPEFRGRPLGHRLDPLRSQLNVMHPELYEAVVQRLLRGHGFVPEREIDCAVFGDVGAVRATLGRLHSRFEWTSPLLTQFGYDVNSVLRKESESFDVQGDVLVIVHSEVLGPPRPTERLRNLATECKAHGVEEALVFFNASESKSDLIFSWRTDVLRPMVVQMPQGLGSLAYNVLTATNVYFEFADRLPWEFINIQ
jgi:hypothetical protein